MEGGGIYPESVSKTMYESGFRNGIIQELEVITSENFVDAIVSGEYEE